MKHWETAVLFVTLIAAYAAAMWILLAFARHAHHRITMMLDSGYGWADAGVMLRRKTKKENGPDPGRHARTAPEHPVAIGELVTGVRAELEQQAWPPPDPEDTGPRPRGMTEPLPTVGGAATEELTIFQE